MCNINEQKRVAVAREKAMKGKEFFCAMDVVREMSGLSRREIAVELYRQFQAGDFGPGWIAQMVNPAEGVYYCVYRKNKAAKALVGKYHNDITSATQVTGDTMPIVHKGSYGWPFFVPESHVRQVWITWQDGGFDLDLVVHPCFESTAAGMGPKTTGLIMWKMRNQSRVRTRLAKGTYRV